MQDNKKLADGAASDLSAELDALRKENETLLGMVSIAAKQREKYAAIEAENKKMFLSLSVTN